jgi:glycosyltransferase involved in cell wall biosynthesis
MKVAVIIPTLGRQALLGRQLAYLNELDRLPDEVIVSAPDETHVPAHLATRYPLSHVFGPSGSSVQRNRGLEAALGRADVVTFFDDDFLPAHNYLARLVECFENLPDVAAIMGHVTVDGARGSGLTFEEGMMILRATEACASSRADPVEQPGAYGCNMSMRAALIGALRFDERLVLYGWQEDIDFTGRLRSRGRIVKVAALQGVHLGASAGRVSGVRFGYSQIVNPTYLIRKGTMPTGFALNLMARNVAANVLKSLWSEPHVDRLGRLKGNLIGAYHMARGRIEPEYVLKL